MADLAILIYPSLFVLAITLLYQVIAGAIYRLFYSPISHIPGPKIAALTFWYVIVSIPTKLSFLSRVICKIGKGDICMHAQV